MILSMIGIKYTNNVIFWIKNRLSIEAIRFLEKENHNILIFLISIFCIQLVFLKMFSLKIISININIKELDEDHRQFALDLLDKLGPKLRNILKMELLRQELKNNKCKVNTIYIFSPILSHGNYNKKEICLLNSELTKLELYRHEEFVKNLLKQEWCVICSNVHTENSKTCQSGCITKYFQLCSKIGDKFRQYD